MVRQHVHDALVVGAGISGVGAAAALHAAGVGDVVAAEAEDRVGGHWRDADFPGAACEVLSPLYSFSFAPNHFGRSYPTPPEICDYLEELVDRHALRDRLRLNTTVTALRFDDALGQWRVRTRGRTTFRARTVVLATGRPSTETTVAIRGRDSYRGRILRLFDWNHDADLTGSRVGVIGGGAEVAQLVPELVARAGFVKVFQRSPGWVLPRWDVEIPPAAQAVLSTFPALRRFSRNALLCGHDAGVAGPPGGALLTGLHTAHLRRRVGDAWLRRQLTPDLAPGGAAVLASNRYYPALQAENCKLIDWPIATISPVGVRTSDGVEHHLDCLVFADDRRAVAPYTVTGLDGSLPGAGWPPGAYKGVSAHGYPNLFFASAPAGGGGRHWPLAYTEARLDYAVRGVTTILGDDLRYLDVRPEAQQRCTPVPLGSQYRRRMREFRIGDYQLVARRAPSTVGARSSA